MIENRSKAGILWPAMLAASAVAVAIIAIWSMRVMSASSSLRSAAAPASAAIDVMQMMKDANNLPDQRYDAH